MIQDLKRDSLGKGAKDGQRATPTLYTIETPERQPWYSQNTITTILLLKKKFVTLPKYHVTKSPGDLDAVHAPQSQHLQELGKVTWILHLYPPSKRSKKREGNEKAKEIRYGRQRAIKDKEYK